MSTVSIWTPFNRRKSPTDRRRLHGGHYVREKSAGEILREAWGLVKVAEAREPSALHRLAYCRD